MNETLTVPVKWTVSVSPETDIAVRTHLAQKGLRKGDLSKFIEAAVRRQVFEQTVREVRERNAHRSAAEIDDIIEQALRMIRAEKFGESLHKMSNCD
jgi:hypothetical protein